MRGPSSSKRAILSQMKPYFSRNKQEMSISLTKRKTEPVNGPGAPACKYCTARNKSKLRLLRVFRRHKRHSLVSDRSRVTGLMTLTNMYPYKTFTSNKRPIYVQKTFQELSYETRTVFDYLLKQCVIRCCEIKCHRQKKRGV